MTRQTYIPPSSYTALVVVAITYSTILSFSSRNCANLVARSQWRVQAKPGKHSTFQMDQNKFYEMKRSPRHPEENARAQIYGVINHSKHGYGELTSNSRLLTALNIFITRCVDSP